MKKEREVCTFLLVLYVCYKIYWRGGEKKIKASPQTLEEIPGFPSNTEEFPLVHHPESPDEEHQRLVRKQHRTRPHMGPAKSGLFG